MIKTYVWTYFSKSAPLTNRIRSILSILSFATRLNWTVIVVREVSISHLSDIGLTFDVHCHYVITYKLAQIPHISLSDIGGIMDKVLLTWHVRVSLLSTYSGSSSLHFLRDEWPIYVYVNYNFIVYNGLDHLQSSDYSHIFIGFIPAWTIMLLFMRIMDCCYISTAI